MLSNAPKRINVVLRVVDWLIDLNREETSTRRIQLPPLFRVPHFEFWNTHLFHLPIYLYWLYLAVKARSLFFFTASNPGIETGGMMGESKIKIMRKIDQRFLPRSLYYQYVPCRDEVLKDIANGGIQFPFIVKPDVGQGGWLVKKICTVVQLEKFLEYIRMPFIIQEFVDHPLEIGLLYYRLPGEKRGTVSSLAVKELLNVIGDGRSSIIRLIQQSPRARKQLKKLLCTSTVDFNRVPAQGEKVVLSFMANHSFGTTFRNYNHVIDERLQNVFDTLCSGIDGFYFGRFDLRCASIDELKNGNFKILELNGAGSEPLHIFDPEEKVKNAYRSAIDHWKMIYRISQRNHALGVSYMKFREAIAVLRKVQRIQQIHNTCFTIGN